ncbi:MAG: hypothetical protein HY020_17945 [Burkholderiales bacterium]|nr:hypothetical protein [Burkholderiales bacterium]
MARKWFPAKRYGWGWGAPRTWQGWLVLAFFALLVAAGVVFQRQLGTLLFMAYIAVISLGPLGVCWLKGEPPRWRWGGK